MKLNAILFAIFLLMIYLLKEAQADTCGTNIVSNFPAMVKMDGIKVLRKPISGKALQEYCQCIGGHAYLPAREVYLCKAKSRLYEVIML